MADSATLNVRMDVETKDAFTDFCNTIGMSASSLMNVFAKTVVRNQAVPFSLTTMQEPSIAARFARIFPQNAAELEDMLAASEATPLSECDSMANGAAQISERINWDRYRRRVPDFSSITIGGADDFSYRLGSQS